MRTIQQLMNLSGRTALVAGGAGHLGRAACETLVEMGARVAVLDRRAVDGQAAVKELPPGSAIALAADLADEKSTRRAVREAVRALGGLDILIHAAAFVGTTKRSGWAVPIQRQTSKAFEAALNVNLTSAFTLTQEAAPALTRSGRATIIFFSSIYGSVGSDSSLYEGTVLANPAGYGASKGGLNQLTRHFATVLAPRVRVNSISPGGVLRGHTKTFISRYSRRTPLRRLAVEEDVKGAVAYLASDLSAYVTGHDLRVDGGWTAW